MVKYLKRIADDILPARMEAAGALLIAGPKWCGKSTTALQHANSVVYMQDTATRAQNIALAKADPALFLSGKVPRLIDEWQVIPFLWDAIRFEVDQRGGAGGQFLLTGSATPVESNEITHSGIGRIARYIMRPMSLFESLESSAEVSWRSLFDGATPRGKSEMKLTDYATVLCRGGWPAAVMKSGNAALQTARDFFEGLVNSEISQVGNVRRSAERARRLLASYARLTATQASLRTICRDMAGDGNTNVNEGTVASYITALENLFIIENLSAWSPRLLAKSRVRSVATRHFVDPSIAAAALGICPGDLMHDLATFGYLFENLAVRDLRIYTEALGGRVYHYRDNTGLEADAVIHLDDGRYALAEIKLFDEDNIETGASNLKKIVAKLDTSKMKPPSFLAVVTGTEYAYRREDGVLVLPLGCLAS